MSAARFSLLVGLCALVACEPASVKIDDGDDTDVLDSVDTDNQDTDNQDTDPDTDDLLPIDPPADPAAVGPYTTTITNGQVRVDGRDVPVIFAGPVELTGPAPIIIYNHGFSTDAAQYRSTADRLASHGYFVALPEWDSSIWASRTHNELANDAIALLDWLITQNNTANTPLSGRLDVTRVGMAGHSRGGKQAFLAAIRDTRITSVAGIDPVDSKPPGFGSPADYPSVTPELMPQLTQPLGVLGAGLAGGSGISACAPTDENWSRYADEAPGRLVRWLLPRAGHLDFLDGCAANPNLINCPLCTIGDAPAGAHAAAQAFLVAYFGSTLTGQTGYDAWLADPSASFPTIAIETELLP